MTIRKLAIQCGLSIAIGAVGIGGMLPFPIAIAQSSQRADRQTAAPSIAPTGALPEAEVLYEQIPALNEQGRYDEAIVLAQQALAVTEKAFGEGHTRTALPLTILATLHRSKGDYAIAISLYERALVPMEPLLSAGMPDLLDILGRMGSLQRELGNYDLARPLFERALSIKQVTLGADSPEVASSLSNLASIYERQGDYASALPLYQQALSISKAALGSNHLKVAIIQSNLAGLYSAQGDYTLALPLFERALATSETKLGRNDPSVATILVNLAELHRLSGDYPSALPLLERALSIDELAFGNHPKVAGILNNLAMLYRDQGNYSSARSLLERAISIYEETLEPNHLELTYALNGLALVYKDLGDYSSAKPLFERALPILKSALGESHPDVAAMLNNIGGLYQESGDYSTALPFYEQALKISEAALGENHPDIANQLNNLALLYRDSKDYALARSLFERALSIRETVLGKNHPHTANTLNNLAGLYQAENKVDRAVELYTLGSAIQSENIDIMMAQSSEARRQQYINALSPMISAVVSLNADNPSDLAATRLALSTVLQRKGRVLDAVANTSEQLRLQLSPQNKDLLDELNNVRSAIANLRFGGSSGSATAQHRAKLSELEHRAEQIEESLTRSSAAFSAEAQPVSIAAIQPLIPADAALVEFVRYQPIDFSKFHNYWGPARYAAYVLTAQGEVKAIDLGAAVSIDLLIAEFQSALSSRATNVKTIGRQLDEQLMAPLRPFLNNKAQLLLSPDSQLTLIPFEALVGEDGRYLIEQYQTSYLTSGRDLVKLQTKSQSQQPPVILANPDYESASASGVASGDRARSVDASNLSFNSLPGTAIEAEAIAPLLPSAKLYTQSRATESILKQLKAPSILHIATHGFFLPDVAFTPAAEARSSRFGATLDVVVVESPTIDAPENITPSNLENPLLRSGLALAGANDRSRKANSDDGIFTALEASGLNLHGTQLVVLSACETGIGAASTGEGVYGLRRAFVTAGAESQLMSLWQVDDYGTSELMTLFYEHLMNDKQGRGEALRNAQLALMNTGTYAHPYYWSSFIVSGDWRSLD